MMEANAKDNEEELKNVNKDLATQLDSIQLETGEARDAAITEARNLFERAQVLICRLMVTKERGFAETYRKELAQLQTRLEGLTGNSADATKTPGPTPEGHVDGIFLRGDGTFFCTAITPSSNHVACAQESGDINVVDVNTGSVVQTFKGHTNVVFNMIWSDDGTLLLSASKDSTARLWDLKSGTCIRVFPHDDTVYDCCFLPNENSVVTTCVDKGVRVWDIVSGECVQKALIKNNGVLTACSFTNNGSLAVMGSDIGQVTVWKRADNTFKTIVTRLGSIRSIRFSPDGLCIAVCGEIPRVPLLDPVKSELIRYCDGLKSSTTSCDFSRDGRLLAATSCDSVFCVWEKDTGTLLHRVSGHTDWVFDVKFAPNLLYLITASHDHTVRIWDADTYQPMTKEIFHKRQEELHERSFFCTKHQFPVTLFCLLEKNFVCPRCHEQKPDHPVIPAAELGMWINETTRVMMQTMGSRISTLRACQNQLQQLDQSRSAATAAVLSAMDMLSAAVDARRKALLNEIDDIYNSAALELRTTQGQVDGEVQELIQPLLSSEASAVAAEEHDTLCMSRSNEDSPHTLRLYSPTGSFVGASSSSASQKPAAVIRFSGNTSVQNLVKQIESVGSIHFTTQ